MNLQQLQARVQGSDNVVFFGGAGVSTESGIPDFRSANGLYKTVRGEQYAPEEVLSRDFFFRDPASFYQFYKSHMIHTSARPNAAHKVLAELEKQGVLRAVVTQNIDGLHQLAGSRNVLELHGSVHRNHCLACGKFHTLEELLASDSEEFPVCSDCGGMLKPDVVLYQEGLNMEVLEQAAAAITEADVLIVAGTSLTVQPAAGLVRLYRGDSLIIVNESPTPMDSMADTVLRERIGTVMQGLSVEY